MREVQVVVYEAWDGTRFDSAKQCRDYESGALHLRLANLTPEQVKAGLDRSDLALAAALEDAGLAVRALRRKANDFRRTPPKVEPKPEPATPDPGPPWRSAPEAAPSPSPAPDRDPPWRVLSDGDITTGELVPEGD